MKISLFLLTLTLSIFPIQKVALSVNNESISAEEYLNKANKNIQDNNNAEAINNYTKAITLNPTFKEAYIQRALLNTQLKMDYKAIIDLKKLIKLNLADSKAYFLLGTTYRKICSYDDKDCIERVLPYLEHVNASELSLEEQTDFHTLKADIYEDLLKYEEAITEYSEAIRLNPLNPVYYLNRGQVLIKQGNYDMAFVDCNKSIELKIDSNNKDPYICRRDYFAVKGTYEQLSNESSKLMDLGYHLEAEQSFDDAQTSDREYREYEYTSDMKKLNQAVQKNKKSYLTYFRRGKYILDHVKKLEMALNNDFEKAFNDITTTIKLNPRFANAYYYRGLVYKRKNLPENALSDFNQAIRLNTLNGEAYYYRGLSYFDSGDYENALKDFKKSLLLKTKTADLNFYIALIYDTQKNNCKEANKYYAISSSLHTDNFLPVQEYGCPVKSE